jgi:membrane-bound lytic murein transglycosylase B
MGQCQFMPSSFFKFAVDYNRDGRTDIWGDKGDVFASAANYLHQSGWKSGQKWGRAVRVPNNIDATLFDLKTAHPLSFWEARGVRLPDGAALPVDPTIQASLMRMNDDSNQSFLVYDNFKTILKWNNSRYFGAAVGMLADHIKNF